MLVEMIDIGAGAWEFKDENYTSWTTHLGSVKPLEALTPTLEATKNVKSVIKLKEAGFTAEEIIEMSKEGVV